MRSNMSRSSDSENVAFFLDLFSCSREKDLYLECCQETDGDDECLLVQQMDKEALQRLLRLSDDIETFTLKELKGFYRRSLVAMEMGLTNNRHIHKQIIELLEENVVVSVHHYRQRQLHAARQVVMKNFKSALQRCYAAQAKLAAAEEQKLAAEERYMDAVSQLSQADMQKRQVLDAFAKQRFGGEPYRKRTTSM